MSMINSIMAWLMKKRFHQIELFMKYPVEVQQENLSRLLLQAVETEWGRGYEYKSISNYAAFKERVPVQDYESLQPFIMRIMQGEQNVLWHSDIKYFAKSSGTTSSKSKFIPVSSESLDDCHYKGGKDMLSIYCNNNPNTQLFTGKNLALGGSLKINDLSANASEPSFAGDLSAIIMHNLPFWAEFYRTPNLEVALMDSWEDKIEELYKKSVPENVISLSGVPSWMLLLIRYILEREGKQNILEVWPNLEVYFHGGISFLPYEQQFKKLLPSPTVRYTQTYSASEGFFGIQDRSDADDMLLMLDYGVFYEFMELNESGETTDKIIMIGDVELHKNYALLITTNAGLWRYTIGDTVTFTSLAPYRIKIAGRTKLFINAFGEELMINNADEALRRVCLATNAILTEYTAAPLFMENSTKGAHEWLIEFEKEPESISKFTTLLDQALKELNSDYEAKRAYNLLLQAPIVEIASAGTFYRWLKSKNKLGGQYKVPRLCNDRTYIEEIIKFC